MKNEKGARLVLLSSLSWISQEPKKTQKLATKKDGPIHQIPMPLAKDELGFHSLVKTQQAQGKKILTESKNSIFIWLFSFFQLNEKRNEVVWSEPGGRIGCISSWHNSCPCRRLLKPPPSSLPEFTLNLTPSFVSFRMFRVLGQFFLLVCAGFHSTNLESWSLGLGETFSSGKFVLSPPPISRDISFGSSSSSSFSPLGPLML